jgi:hypothetical protein
MLIHHVGVPICPLAIRRSTDRSDTFNTRPVLVARYFRSLVIEHYSLKLAAEDSHAVLLERNFRAASVRERTCNL